MAEMKNAGIYSVIWGLSDMTDFNFKYRSKCFGFVSIKQVLGIEET